MRFGLFGMFFLLAACENSEQPQAPYVIVQGRDTATSSERPPLYRIILPPSWEVSTSETSVIDTRLPLFEAHYQKKDQKIRLTIHNFPYEDTAQRIPPLAQIARWKEQFDILHKTEITPQAFAGFAGYHCYAEGINNRIDSAVSAWAMQLAPEHEQTLRTHKTTTLKQTRSDITIKATGPSDLMLGQHDAISAIARSFELINPLPNP